jgi:glycosyltransferase involved in cell wall biosynthesis
VLLEAMILGAPIVAHPNQGYQWVMKDTGRLSLVDVKNPEEFARRLVLLMEDEDLRKIWQAWAKEYIKQFSYKKIVDEYESIYKNLIKK